MHRFLTSAAFPNSRHGCNQSIELPRIRESSIFWGLWVGREVGACISPTKLEKMATLCNLEEPWKTPNARKLDMMTLKTWWDKQCWAKESKAMGYMAFEMLLSHHPS